MTATPLSNRRVLGPTGIQVSPLCLGGNVFGWTADQAVSFEVLDAFVEAGGNFIDTADSYSSWSPGNTGGESEAIIGAWMRSRGNRADVIIATKVAKWDRHRGLSASTIRAACHESLDRLHTDYIDLYYAHEDDQAVPLTGTLGAFDTLVTEGKVRHIGASNFTAERLREALSVSREHGFAAYAAVQNLYNLMERKAFETGIAVPAEEFGLAVLTHYSLARGFLSGKYRGGATSGSPRAESVESYRGDAGDRVVAALDVIAANHAVSPAAIALAWLSANAVVTAPIASARTVGQLNELLPFAQVHLTPDELATLGAASS